MTFKEALDTGYRITASRPNTDLRWYKKIDKKTVLFHNNIRLSLSYLIKHCTGSNYRIHPDDQKIIDFNKELEKVLE